MTAWPSPRHTTLSFKIQSNRQGLIRLFLSWIVSIPMSIKPVLNGTNWCARVHNRSKVKVGYAEKWNNFTRAYWCITCSYCNKEVRFCTMCQGELIPVDIRDSEDKAYKKLQCTECHRVINMRFCSACGHQFKEEGIDARMETPGVNVSPPSVIK